ncbi:pantothenate kinase type III, CoaX-like [Porphyromonas crevioricanis JCM 15906]|uniref:Type III pantothenate kinase n=1 Tax=Porphyromonas crevioricanis JCM 15906 TaxID=1305617 RepID=T1CGP6_9PORP|nr:type III pantothenate kinase [Porphyromonas crevioricanis]GAD04896.1 pantothenate kinase type III, CoaX-like [Porphyromonas crevioricanis JCM 15906]SJZ73837.1 type III pantothenate kinase [Porphyromonas crevioricanis]
MQRSLIIDRGNTNLKVAIFENQELVGVRHLSASTYIGLKNTFSSEELLCHSCIFSSVAQVEDPILEDLKGHFCQNLYVLNDQMPIPIEIDYDRTTLGADRLAAVVGAGSLFPQEEILVIDAGTAVTYERISSQGKYLGGNISPGLEVRFSSLHHYTARLPLVHIHESDNIPQWGTNTSGAIMAGVVRGLILEMEGYIEAARQEHPEIRVLLTGGAASYFETKLKYQTFVADDLVLRGLSCILDYQIRECTE